VDECKPLLMGSSVSSSLLTAPLPALTTPIESIALTTPIESVKPAATDAQQFAADLHKVGWCRLKP